MPEKGPNRPKSGDKESLPPIALDDIIPHLAYPDRMRFYNALCFRTRRTRSTVLYEELGWTHDVNGYRQNAVQPLLDSDLVRQDWISDRENYYHLNRTHGKDTALLRILNPMLQFGRKLTDQRLDWIILSGRVLLVSILKEPKKIEALNASACILSLADASQLLQQLYRLQRTTGPELSSALKVKDATNMRAYRKLRECGVIQVGKGGFSVTSLDPAHADVVSQLVRTLEASTHLMLSLGGRVKAKKQNRYRRHSVA